MVCIRANYFMEVIFLFLAPTVLVGSYRAHSVRAELWWALRYANLHSIVKILVIVSLQVVLGLENLFIRNCDGLCDQTKHQER